MVLLHYTSDQFEQLGLRVAGFPDSVQNRTTADRNLSRFKDAFGATPTVCSLLFDDLQTTDLPTKISKPNVEYYLMTLCWFRTYRTRKSFAGQFKVHENTVTNYIWPYAKAIQGLKEQKIRWEFAGPDGELIHIVSVDGVHCRIYEVRIDPGAKWMSQKFGGPGVSYELAIAIRSSRLVWIAGPYPASTHDITIFRKALKGKIPAGKRAVADLGYRGEPDVVAFRNDFDDKRTKEFKGRVGARHESFNGRLKAWKILDVSFRHGVGNHQTVFEAICVIEQYNMENGNPLFSALP